MPDRPLLTARSVFFVPGDAPDPFSTAASSGADLLVLDLEDAVADAGKVEARRHVATWLLAGHRAAVRVNSAGCPQHPHDIAALRDMPGLLGVVVPKAEDPAVLADLTEELGGRVPLMPMIETALGISRVSEIAAVDGVERLSFGRLDYVVDIDAADDPLGTLFARSTLVNVSRAARLAGPVDGVTTDVLEPSVTRGDARQARRLGFTGKACIHPHQVESVNEAFQPSAQEVAWARAVLESCPEGSGSTLLAGHLIEPSLVDRARRILALVDN